MHRSRGLNGNIHVLSWIGRQEWSAFVGKIKWIGIAREHGRIRGRFERSRDRRILAGRIGRSRIKMQSLCRGYRLDRWSALVGEIAVADQRTEPGGCEQSEWFKGLQAFLIKLIPLRDDNTAIR